MCLCYFASARYGSVRPTTGMVFGGMRHVQVDPPLPSTCLFSFFSFSFFFSFSEDFRRSISSIFFIFFGKLPKREGGEWKGRQSEVGFYTFCAICRMSWWSECLVVLCTTSAINAWINGSPRENLERSALPYQYLFVYCNPLPDKQQD